MLKYLMILMGATAVMAQANHVSVSQAKQLKDDTPVVLHGAIGEKVGDEKYIFSDGTDTIVVEIDYDKMIVVAPTDTVEIIGKIDQDKKGVEVDVDAVIKK